jgi:hypothetical protein
MKTNIIKWHNTGSYIKVIWQYLSQERQMNMNIKGFYISFFRKLYSTITQDMLENGIFILSRYILWR